MQLIVQLTDDQYNRFKNAMQSIAGAESEITDDNLIAQMKREAAAITYAAENGSQVEDWKF